MEPGEILPAGGDLGKPRSGFRFRLSSLSTVHLFMMLPWVGIIVAARQPIRDNSFLWHVRAGAMQVDSGRVLTSDPFSFTFTGAPWRTQSWLADLAYAWLHDLTQLDFVPWLIGVVSLLTVALLGLGAIRASGSPVAAAVALTLVAWVGVAFLSPRPVIFSYGLLALTAVILDRPRLRWVLPLVLWVWAALHASFVLGIGLIVLHGLARRRRWGRDVLAVTVAASLTAHGWGVWETLGRFATNRPALDLISEWAPPRLTSPDLFPYLIFVALVVWGASTGSITRGELTIVVPFLLFGLTASRSLFPAVVVLTPYIAKAVGNRADARVGQGGVPWAFNAVVAVVILLLPFVVAPRWDGLSETRFPVAEAAVLGPGPVFHDDVIGGYLIYARPDVAVFVDDRAELYGAEHFRDLVATRGGRPGWDDVFSTHGITQALVGVDDGLAEVLDLAGWTRLSEGDNFVLFSQ